MHGLLDLFWIRIALLDQTHRQTVRAEYQMNSRTVRELPQYGSDPLNQRLNIQRVLVKIVDGAFRWFGTGVSPLRLIDDPAPFLQASQRRGVGIMRVEWQEDAFIQEAGRALPLPRLAGARGPSTDRPGQPR